MFFSHVWNWWLLVRQRKPICEQIPLSPVFNVFCVSVLLPKLCINFGKKPWNMITFIWQSKHYCMTNWKTFIQWQLLWGIEIQQIVFMKDYLVKRSISLKSWLPQPDLQVRKMLSSTRFAEEKICIGWKSWIWVQLLRQWRVFIENGQLKGLCISFQRLFLSKM